MEANITNFTLRRAPVHEELLDVVQGMFTGNLARQCEWRAVKAVIFLFREKKITVLPKWLACCLLLPALCFMDMGTKSPSLITASHVVLVTIIATSRWCVSKSWRDHLTGWGWAFQESEQTLQSPEGGREGKRHLQAPFASLISFCHHFVAPSFPPWASPTQIPFCVSPPKSDPEERAG